MNATLATVGSALDHAARRLATAGVPEPELDATLLLGECLGLSRTLLCLRRREPLASDVLSRFETMLARRLKREPLAYILGWQEFCGLRLRCDPRVLVPRWDSEPLVDRLVSHLAGAGPVVVADLGTGSGALALAVAEALPLARVVAVDCSADALQVATLNATAHGLDDRVKFERGDLGAPLLDQRTRCHAVIANLPYIPDADLPELMPEVARFEPALALRGGADGLDLVRRLLDQLPALLLPGGLAVLEHGDGQGPAVEHLVGRHPELRLLPPVDDLEGRRRGVVLEHRL